MDCRVKPGNDDRESKRKSAIPRHESAQAFIDVSPLKGGRGECRALAAPAASCVK
jgi:hypothetical protein